MSSFLSSIFPEFVVSPTYFLNVVVSLVLKYLQIIVVSLIRRHILNVVVSLVHRYFHNVIMAPVHISRMALFLIRR